KSRQRLWMRGRVAMAVENENNSEPGRESPEADNVDQSAAQTAVATPSAAQAPSESAAADDRLLRLQAEMQNLRNRTSREIADERRYAALPVLRDLLPVVDNID